jgi:hypothetical protein
MDGNYITLAMTILRDFQGSHGGLLEFPAHIRGIAVG